MRTPKWVSIIAACVLAVLGALALDALAFRTPWYISNLEPDSSTGLFELILAREQDAQKRNGDNMVVTLGDSRFAYAPRLSNEVTAQTGYVFRHAGVAGSDARAWYYMMRDLDPTRRRYRAVVFGMNDYDDEDEFSNPNDDIRALHYVIARLRLEDVAEFAMSFDSPALRWEAFRDGIWKGTVFQADMLAFLSHPKYRLGEVAFDRHGFEEWTYGYLETPRSMEGLSIDWKTMKATMPPTFDENQVDTVKNALLREPAPQTGRVAAFRRHWLGKIIDLLPRLAHQNHLPAAGARASGAPGQPGAQAQQFDPRIRRRAPTSCWSPSTPSIRWSVPNCSATRIHLNREGIARFSPMMAVEVGRLLDRGRPKGGPVTGHALQHRQFLRFSDAWCWPFSTPARGPSASTFCWPPATSSTDAGTTSSSPCCSP